MKKFLSAFILLLSPFIFFYSAQNTFAQANIVNNQPVILAKDQVINDDYVVRGSAVDILGTVNGDVYAVGGTVTVQGTINGDLLAVGGNITVTGNITGNIRVIGGNITVTGNIGRNFSSLGGSVSLTDSAKVGGSITSAGGMFALYGPIAKDIRIAGGQVALGDIVGGNVFIAAGKMSVASSSRIAGNVTYWSNQKLDVATGATIAGKVSQNMLPKKSISSRIQPTRIIPALATFAIFGKVTGFLASFTVGLLLIIFFPLYAQKITTITTKGFWANVGIGFLSVIIAPIIIVLFLVTLIGIPLAIITGILFGFFAYAAGIIAAMVIGKWAIKYVSKKDHLIWSLFVGLIIFKVLEIIPLLGWIFSAVFIMAGLGAILMERKHNYVQLRAKKLI